MNVEVGDLVKITQQLMREGKAYPHASFSQVSGSVERVRAAPTHSWHARRHDGRLHLLELLIRKSDGERSSVVIDPDTRVEVLIRGRAPTADRLR